jgi:hypothetical protein
MRVRFIHLQEVAVPETAWQQQLKQFLNKAGEELKRTGEEIKAEAQRLMVEVRDPQKQQKMKEGLRDLSTWARRTADQAADLIDTAVKKAEQTWAKPVGKTEKSEPPARPAAQEPVTEKVHVAEEKKAEAAEKPAKKTVAKKKSGSKAAPRAAGKTIGKKKKPS